MPLEQKTLPLIILIVTYDILPTVPNKKNNVLDFIGFYWESEQKVPIILDIVSELHKTKARVKDTKPPQRGNEKRLSEFIASNGQVTTVDKRNK